MAEYKTADKLPILEEVTESTYALVEDNGTLKRVPGSSLGGGKACVFRIFDLENGNGNTCNMSFKDLYTAWENKEIDSINIFYWNEYAEQCGMGNNLRIYISEDQISIGCYFCFGGEYYINYNPDGSITGYLMD